MNGGNDERSTIAVFHVGEVHLDTNQRTRDVGHDMALKAFDFLGRIKTARPTVPVVLTDWLSMTPAGKLGSRPADHELAATARN